MDNRFQAGSSRRTPNAAVDSDDLPDLGLRRQRFSTALWVIVVVLLVLMLGCGGTVLAGAFFWLMASNAPSGPAPVAMALADPADDLLGPRLAPEQAVAQILQRGGSVRFHQEEVCDLALPVQATDHDLAAVKLFPKLKWLRLTDTAITDDGLKHLQGLTDLQYLCLQRTAVTDTGLLHLRRLTELQDLDVEKTQVTDKGVRQLQQALPKVRIKH